MFSVFVVLIDGRNDGSASFILLQVLNLLFKITV